MNRRLQGKSTALQSLKSSILLYHKLPGSEILPVQQVCCTLGCGKPKCLLKNMVDIMQIQKTNLCCQMCWRMSSPRGKLLAWHSTGGV